MEKKTIDTPTIGKIDLALYKIDISNYISGLRIIETSENDITESAKVIRQSFATIAAEFDLTKENAPTNGAFIEDDRLMDDFGRGVKMFGIANLDRQIGFMALEQKDCNTFYLEKLAVLPEFRHNGCGRMLVAHAKEYVKQAGADNISIGIIYENKLFYRVAAAKSYTTKMKGRYPSRPLISL